MLHNDLKKKIFLLVLAAGTFTAAAKAEEKDVLLFNNTEESLYIYEDIQLENPAGVLLPDRAAYLTAERDNAYKIESGSISGYLPKDAPLSIGDEAWEEAVKSCPLKAELKGRTVFVYEENDLSGRIVDLMSEGDTVSVTKQEDHVLEVVTLNGIEGYMAAKGTEVKPVLEYAEEIDWDIYYKEHPEAYSTYGSDEEYDQRQGITGRLTGEQIARYACQFEGNPYVWGGESLTDGADCSGFIQSVYKHFGINIPRTSYEMRTAGRMVSEGWVQELASPGDIICYEGHAALYIGDGQIIHASNPKDGIKISRADYREILCVRRILGSRDAADLDKKSVEILCRIVEAEAAGEGLKGKMLVAGVILNRLESPAFPDTVEKIVFARSGGTWQFSPVGNGRYYTVKISEETRKAVYKALNGEDHTQGALYFMARAYSDKKNAAWFDHSLEYLFQYGSHEFFK